MKANPTATNVPDSQDLYVLDEDGQPDVEKCCRVLKRRFEELGDVDGLDKLVKATLAATDAITPSFLRRHAEYELLFKLAGIIKGVLPKSLRSDADYGAKLAPLAILYVEALKANAKLAETGRHIQWHDQDAITLEFEKVWEKRKYAEGIELLQAAVDFATENPLGIEGNRYMALVVNAGYYLQKAQGDEPIFLPVSDKLAGLLNTSQMTLGTAVQRAISKGYFIEVPKPPGKMHVARRFRLDFDHPGIKNRPDVEVPEPSAQVA